MVPEDTYEVHALAQEGAIQVFGTNADPRITVHITLTSPVVREQVVPETSAGGESANHKICVVYVKTSMLKLSELYKCLLIIINFHILCYVYAVLL